MIARERALGARLTILGEDAPDLIHEGSRKALPAHGHAREIPVPPGGTGQAQRFPREFVVIPCGLGFIHSSSRDPCSLDLRGRRYLEAKSCKKAAHKMRLKKNIYICR